MNDNEDKHEKRKKEIELISSKAVWGTFDGVNSFIKTHNIDWKSEVYQITTLHISCRFGHILLVKQLIENGSNINAKDFWRHTPLFYAVEHSHHNVITFLLKKNAKINEKDHRNKTVLHEACKKDDIVSVRLLLENGAFVNIQEDFLKQTPLHYVVDNFNFIKNLIPIVKLLIEFYADIWIIDRYEKTPEDHAKIDWISEEITIEDTNRRIEVKGLLEKESQLAPLKRRHSYTWLVKTWKSLSKKTYSHKEDMKSKADFNKRPRIS